MLTYIVYEMPRDRRYVEFEIPKKSGGMRRINAPVAKLRALQRSLAKMLDQCSEELRLAEGRKLGALSHGFRKGYSIATNAAPHRSQRYVLNIDLRDFFPSINFGRVRGFFLKNRNFKLNEKVATTIAQIACYNNGLPQGAPSSPIISNLVAHILDVRLAKFAGKNGCVYSRYADDITFSTHAKTFPADLAFQVGDNNEWVLAEELRDEIESCGFKINPLKTRMQSRANRQLVTGLTVNSKVNVRTEYYRSVRAACDKLFSSGDCFKVDRFSGEEKSLSAEALTGRMNHVQHIRALSDLREEKAKLERPTAAHSLYRRLTFYNAFAAPTLPLVVCEGKTDNVYLKCALRRLSAKFPKLIELVDGKLVPKIRFFNYERRQPFEYHSTPKQLSQLNGGAPHIKGLVQVYHDAIGYYDHAPRQAPIIALIDNDAGAKDLFGLLRNRDKIKIDALSVEPFYHITDNLFLVKTPELGATGTSCIEDLFEPAVRATQIDGKSFNPTNEKVGPMEYGKTIFAERVIKPNAATINFDSFEPLFARIEKVIVSYKAPPA